MIVNERGGVLDDLIVYRLGDEEFMVVANASNYEMVGDELKNRAKSYDAVVDDRSDQYALIAVQGPRAQAILATLTDADLAGLKYYAGLPGLVDGRQALIARTGYTGEDGFELFVANQDAVPLWHALTEAGEPYDLQARGAVQPRHAPAGGGHAAVRQRARRRRSPRSTRGWAEW